MNVEVISEPTPYTEQTVEPNPEPVIAEGGEAEARTQRALEFLNSREQQAPHQAPAQPTEQPRATKPAAPERPANPEPVTEKPAEPPADDNALLLELVRNRRKATALEQELQQLKKQTEEFSPYKSALERLKEGDATALEEIGGDFEKLQVSAYETAETRELRAVQRQVQTLASQLEEERQARAQAEEQRRQAMEQESAREQLSRIKQDLTEQYPDIAAFGLETQVKSVIDHWKKQSLDTYGQEPVFNVNDAAKVVADHYRPQLKEALKKIRDLEYYSDLWTSSVSEPAPATRQAPRSVSPKETRGGAGVPPPRPSVASREARLEAGLAALDQMVRSTN